jgi:hypothetical protein
MQFFRDQAVEMKAVMDDSSDLVGDVKPPIGMGFGHAMPDDGSPTNKIIENKWVWLVNALMQREKNNKRLVDLRKVYLLRSVTQSQLPLLEIQKRNITPLDDLPENKKVSALLQLLTTSFSQLILSLAEKGLGLLGASLTCLVGSAARDNVMVDEGSDYDAVVFVSVDSTKDLDERTLKYLGRFLLPESFTGEIRDTWPYNPFVLPLGRRKMERYASLTFLNIEHPDLGKPADVKYVFVPCLVTDKVADQQKKLRQAASSDMESRVLTCNASMLYRHGKMWAIRYGGSHCVALIKNRLTEDRFVLAYILMQVDKLVGYKGLTMHFDLMDKLTRWMEETTPYQQALQLETYSVMVGKCKKRGLILGYWGNYLRSKLVMRGVFRNRYCASTACVLGGVGHVVDDDKRARAGAGGAVVVTPA